MGRSLVWSLGLALVLSLGSSGLARADAASATVTPATGGNGVPVLFGHAEFDLGTVGYTQEEFFVEGTADAYQSAVPLTNDGKWTVTPFSPAVYKTRMVVNRPSDPGDFNGSVIVEWFNVSGGVDASPDWQHMHVELIREGYAWVGVSAQFVGVDQLINGHPTNPAAPGDFDRYGPPGGNLIHPGDSHSYDIFAQTGQAVRDQAGLVLGGLQPERLIAAGESQSAGRLTTYINAVHPLVEVYDAFVVHSRGSSGSPLTQPPLVTVSTPSPTFTRDDLGVPVMVFINENDTGSFLARQDDGPLYRRWEVTGTAHFDLYGLAQAGVDTGDRESVRDWFDSMLEPTDQPNPTFTCPLPINSGPATYVMRALVRSLNTWLVDGTPAPTAPRLEVIDILVTPFGLEIVYEEDEVGNVVGGIRTPALDAPVARLNGQGQPPAGFGLFCRLFGVTVPLTEQQLTDLYGDRDGFVSAWMQATQAAVKAGFLLREDARDIRVVGAQSDVLK